ncbi:thiamine phosphate synthase, partial [Allisonella histaminiformans]
MNMRSVLDISAYLVVGPENTKGRPVRDIVKAALDGGFTCVQLRSKVASAREMISLCKETAQVIAESGKSDSVVLLVDDRLDVVLAAREAGIKVDGIHVGQSDIPVEVCRKYLGKDSVVGLSARTEELLDYVAH